MSDPDCRVTIPNGRIKGGREKSLYSDLIYYKFCGIPYAQPPVGPSRFLPPRPAKAWSGTLDATKDRSECIQFCLMSKRIIGSEDCLYLNVYTSEAPRKITKLRPVLVEIHGGGHFGGSCSFVKQGRPDFFIQNDIIFVSMNFRLNVFGFLNLELPQCAGNMGLKDQSLALKWIKENIRYFGGDPDNITLHGVSSGSTDIHLHMLSPMSKDLFHKAIMQCGYAINPTWSYQTNHIERAFDLAKELLFNGKNKHSLLNFLRKQNAVALIVAYTALKEKLRQSNKLRGDICVFYPTTEVFEKDAFMCRSPRELIFQVPPKPLICSVTALEGLVTFFSDPIPAVRNEFARSLKEHLWMYKMSDEMRQTISQEIKTFYLGQKEADMTTVKEIIDIYTDIWYCEWHDWLDFASTNPAEAPIYVYYFDHDGKLNISMKQFSKYVPGGQLKIQEACHGDDSAYFFMYPSENGEFPELNLTNSDAKVIENMTTLFINFVKNGDPNNKKFANVHWVPHDANNPSYLHLDEELQVIPDRVFGKRAIFWKNLMKRIREHEKEMLNETDN